MSRWTPTHEDVSIFDPLKSMIDKVSEFGDQNDRHGGSPIHRKNIVSAASGGFAAYSRYLKQFVLVQKKKKCGILNFKIKWIFVF